MNPRGFDALLKIALAEDAARNDITSLSVIPQKSRIKAAIIAKEPGILSGIDLAARVFKLQDQNLSVRTLKKDGSAIKPGQAVLTVEGSTRSIFAAERAALNFLGHLSGIATLTSQFVRRAQPYGARIMDTRKTLPGLRLFEKYAVRAGNGDSHRKNLAEAILIKTNHLRALSPTRGVSSATIQRAIRAARQRAGKRFVEIEVTNLRELKAALVARPDAILLDNWRLADIRRAVALRQKLGTATDFPMLEVSGGVALKNIRTIAKTGIDRISIGRLTHSAPMLDVTLRVL